ncbi:hypothetical protein [Chitinimonas sp.]|uniref:hypothetical protein n=1 Tax=Chitinimonas sp. TaxID=1934313 RepID=UPI0035AF36AA
MASVHRKSVTSHRGAKRPSLDRFEPVLALAKITAEDLLQRGGQLISASRDQVQIRRGTATATIDAQGRVSWQVGN